MSPDTFNEQIEAYRETIATLSGENLYLIETIEDLQQYVQALATENNQLKHINNGLVILGRGKSNEHVPTK